MPGSINSKTAKLSVLDPPAFVAQPQDMLFATGGNATLEVTVSGSKTLLFKWFKDGSEIPKATKSRLTLKKASAARDDGTYKVEVTNGGGSITSDDFNVSIITPVEVSADPEDASFVMGTEGTLSVTASGGGTITYQWEKLDPKSKKWSPVDGATSATLTIAISNPVPLVSIGASWITVPVRIIVRALIWACILFLHSRLIPEAILLMKHARSLSRAGYWRSISSLPMGEE